MTTTTRRTLPPGDRRHGTLSGYKIHRCRCAPCTTANRDYNNQYDRLHAYGRWESLVDAEPVRRHVNKLRADGLGVARIAEVAGVAQATVQNLVWTHRTGRPQTKRLRPRVAAALLAVRVTPDTLAAGAFVDATGTRRRIQALAAFGWPLAEQSRRLGRPSVRNFRDLLTQEQVTARTEREVRDLYEHLSATPPPAGWVTTRTRRMAQARGWAPPLAWDDDSIDDPNAVPDLGGPDTDTSAEPVDDVDEVLVRRALAGHAPLDALNPAEQDALWRAWERQRRERFEDLPGLTDFANLHGVTTAVAERIRNHAHGLTAAGKPRKKNTTTTTSSAATGRTTERKAA